MTAWLVETTPLRRRLVTVPAYVVAWVLLTGLLPLFLLVAGLVGVIRRRSFIVFRLIAFAWIYLSLALVMLMLLCAAYAGTPARLDARVARASTWYGSSLLKSFVQLLSVSIVVVGDPPLATGPVIVLVRHVSIVDAVFPAAFLAKRGAVLRYVLKKELMLEPCLDIAGHLGRHCFLDRDGPPRRELRKVTDLARDLGTDAVVIFPEGTRFTEEKRVEALAQLERTQPELAPIAATMTHVLPPKVAGIRQLLHASPEADCVIMAHRGLEGFAKPSDFLEGSIVGQQIVVRVDRISRDRIARGGDEARWLFTRWREVDDFAGARQIGHG